MTIIFLKVKLRKVIAVIRVDIDNRNYSVVNCSNHERCQSCGLSKCPAYCEIVVAAKDFAYRRRKPRASVMEIPHNEIGIEV